MPAEPLFLARDSYRHRRLGDAARLLPWLGGAVFLAPIVWVPQSVPHAGTSAGVIYLFGGWAVLIVLSAGIARRLGRADPKGAPGNGAPDLGRNSPPARAPLAGSTRSGPTDRPDRKDRSPDTAHPDTAHPDTAPTGAASSATPSPDPDR